MNGISNEELSKLAKLLATLPPPTPADPGDPGRMEHGQVLVHQHRCNFILIPFEVQYSALLQIRLRQAQLDDQHPRRDRLSWHLALVLAIGYCAAHGLALRPLSWRCELQRRCPGCPLPISVIIVITSPKSAGLRIYNEMTGLLILHAHHLVVASFLSDQDIHPALGHELLPDLIFTDRSVAGDENGSFAALPNEIKISNRGRGSDEQDTHNRPYEHPVSHPRSP
jgi:hypothetical protein